MNENQKAIIEFLQRQRRPCSTSTVNTGVRGNLATTSQELLDLQSQRIVRRRTGGWQSCGTLQNPDPPTPLPDPGPDKRGTTPEPAAGPTLDPNSRWHDFRRLCLYYAECLRLDERPFISAYADKRGVSWAELAGSVAWRNVSSDQIVSVLATDEIRDLVQATERARGTSQLVLGLAIDAKLGDEYKLISPILLVRVQAAMGDGVIRLLAVTQPEINQKWLELRFRNIGNRREFVDAMGVLPTAASLGSEGDEDLADNEPLLLPSLEDSLQELFRRTETWWKEYPNLDERPTSPLLEEVTEPGIYNRAVLMSIPDLKYAKRLHEELHELAYKVSDPDLDGSALVHMFPHTPNVRATHTSSETGTPDRIVELMPMNQDQREACEAAMHEPLLVVTGPPGTGKSTVVQTILANLAIRGKTGLFASRNHQGLEAVEPKLNAVVDPDVLMLRPTYPYKSKERRFDWQKVMVDLLCRPPQDGVLEERSSAVTRLDHLLEEQHGLESNYCDLLRLRDALVELDTQINNHRHDLPDSLAHITRHDIAPVVIGDLSRSRRQIQWWLGLPRPLRWLIGPIANWLFRRRLNCSVNEDINPPLQEAVHSLRQANGLDHLSRLLEPWSRLHVIHTLEEEYALVEAEIGSKPDRKLLNERLQTLHGDLHDAGVAALRRVSEAAGVGISDEQRLAFARIRAGFQNRGYDLGSDDPFLRELNKAFRKVMPELIRHYPLWAVSNLSVSKALPLTPGTFDLVIVDEASQCDIPSMIPLLFRAQRAMVVGDPMQLKHVTQIRRDADMNVRRRLKVDQWDFEELSYAANSLFDVASTRPGVSLTRLSSHYRSHPDIADYCNNEFYTKTLWIRTSDASVRARLGRYDGPRGCCWTHVAGSVESVSHGCWSPHQIDAVERELKRLETMDFEGSVGVVTPFAAQADRIRDRVHDHFGKDLLNRWQFLVSTVDGFQGDERDLILFSLVSGDDLPQGCLKFLKDNPNRFNVAVSRARLVMHVLGDQEWAERCGIKFICVLLHHCRQSETTGEDRTIRTDLIGPVWEPRFADALRDAGLPVEQQYPAGGYFLDIGLLRNGFKLDVEVDGECHRDAVTGRRRVDDIYRDMVLQSLGWKVLRFWVYELKENFDGCVKDVCSAFERGPEAFGDE